jgi:hypothetical protein
VRGRRPWDGGGMEGEDALRKSWGELYQRLPPDSEVSDGREKNLKN